MNHYDVLIVGAGHAGAQAAAALRQLGFKGSIGLLGDELDPPYDRPSLSKDYFAGVKTLERMLIRPKAFWERRNIDLLLGKRADYVDAAGKVVGVGSERIRYDKLIWCTGGSPRPLSCPGWNLPNVHAVRRRSDVDQIVASINDIERVAIVGGGYIGLEAAAVLRKFDKHVVVLEARDRLLARVAGEEISSFYLAYHRAKGVDVRLNAEVDFIEPSDGKAATVVLGSGERIKTDMVIVGIGIRPDTGPLISAGADGADGVDVDEFCRTNLPDLYAIGDCAAHTNRYAGGRKIRLESVQNATDQAKTTATHILGKAEPYDALPWFWSDQYELRLQTVGISAGYDRTIVRGSPDTDSFSVWYFKHDQLIAVDAVNSVQDFVQARTLVLSRGDFDPAKLSDPNSALAAV